jgi:hypothetical protein
MNRLVERHVNADHELDRHGTAAQRRTQSGNLRLINCGGSIPGVVMSNSIEWMSFFDLLNVRSYLVQLGRGNDSELSKILVDCLAYLQALCGSFGLPRTGSDLDSGRRKLVFSP